MEALLRWQHPERGPIRPDQLIKLAEHTAVMRLLTLRIIDEVVEQVAKWSAAGLHAAGFGQREPARPADR